MTPFALFRIRRDETKNESNMEYILDLEKSFFSLKNLDGKDLIFADPMNATGGSLVTIVKYLLDQGIKPKSMATPEIGSTAWIGQGDLGTSSN